MIKVICINGISCAGKDTFIDLVERSIGKVNVRRMSTIDPIKELYSDFFKWNGEKTPQDRTNLNALKNMWRDTCNGPINYVKDYLNEFSIFSIGYLFVMVREFEEMNDIKKVAKDNGNAAYTLKVTRDLTDIPEVEQKFLDSHPKDFEYDIIINNPTTSTYPYLPILQCGVSDFLKLTKW